VVKRVYTWLAVIQVRGRYPFVAPTPTNYLWSIAVCTDAVCRVALIPPKSAFPCASIALI
jgi:hypothetical protein